MKSLRLAVALLIGAAVTANATANAGAVSAGQKKSLKECLQPAVKKGGFALDGQILWCPSVIKVGDTYHLFASRWPAQYGLGGWTRYSECVRRDIQGSAGTLRLCGSGAPEAARQLG